MLADTVCLSGFYLQTTRPVVNDLWLNGSYHTCISTVYESEAIGHELVSYFRLSNIQQRLVAFGTPLPQLHPC